MLYPPACSTRPPSGAQRLERESNTNAMRLSTAACSDVAYVAQQQTFAASVADPHQTAAVQRACDVSQATGTLRDASGETARPLQGTRNKAKSIELLLPSALEGKVYISRLRMQAFSLEMHY